MLDNFKSKLPEKPSWLHLEPEDNYALNSCSEDENTGRQHS